MTKQEVRDYLRLYFDSDEEEFPDALINVWLDEGIMRVSQPFDNWNWFDYSWTDVTVANAALASSVADALDSTIQLELPQTIRVTDWDRTLDFIPHEVADETVSLAFEKASAEDRCRDDLRAGALLSEVWQRYKVL